MLDEERIKKLESKIDDWTDKLIEIKGRIHKFDVGQIVILKESGLKVRIVKTRVRKNSQTKRKENVYDVIYAHLDAEYYDYFTVTEDMVAEVPSDYNKYIFEKYISLLVKYDKLIKMLRAEELE